MTPTAPDREPVPDQAMLDAKQPTTVLAGPYGHPFHPIFVTVPIGAWVISFAFDVGSRLAGEPEVFNKGAYWLIALGILGAIAAALFGLFDLLAIPRGTRAFRVGLLHMTINLAVTATFAAGLALRRSGLDGGAVDVVPVAVSAVALAALGVSGWLGGMLAYRYGVRVADEATQEEGFR